VDAAIGLLRQVGARSARLLGGDLLADGCSASGLRYAPHPCLACLTSLELPPEQEGAELGGGSLID